jgi:hypothetical protein
MSPAVVSTCINHNERNEHNVFGQASAGLTTSSVKDCWNLNRIRLTFTIGIGRLGLIDSCRDSCADSVLQNHQKNTKDWDIISIHKFYIVLYVFHMVHSICILNRWFGSVQDPARLHRIEAPRGEIAGLELRCPRYVHDMSMGPWWSMMVQEYVSVWIRFRNRLKICWIWMNMLSHVVTFEMSEWKWMVMCWVPPLSSSQIRERRCRALEKCLLAELNYWISLFYFLVSKSLDIWVQKGGLQMNSNLRELSKMDIVWDERHERWDLWKRHRKASCLNTLAHTMRTHEGIERKVKFMWRWSVLWLRVVVKSL